ncbi:MAG: hypothetical protein Q8R30_03740 [bacterium]|nr:hypothetical protein [bacterium]MDZ4285794.1 hypothetical protein [Candidatus Sungbacteria bacterium]
MSEQTFGQEIDAQDIFPSDAINYGRSLYRGNNARDSRIREASQRYVIWFENIVSSFPSHTKERTYTERLLTAGTNLAQGIDSRKQRYEREVDTAHSELEILKRLTSLGSVIGNVSKVALNFMIVGGLFFLLFHSLLGLPDLWQVKGPREPNYKVIITLIGTCLVGIAGKLFSTSRYHTRLIHIKKLEDQALRTYRKSVRHEHDRCMMKSLEAWKAFTGEDYSEIKLMRDGVVMTFEEEEFMPNQLKNEKSIKLLRILHLIIRTGRLTLKRAPAHPCGFLESVANRSQQTSARTGHS